MSQIDIDEMMNNVLGMDDQFKFECDCCGKCCEFRNDILLSPIDLHRIANYFERDISYIVYRYCDVHIGSDSKIPIIVLKSIGKKQSCPFLVKKKCSINRVKPTVCKLFPLGRFRTFSEDKNGLKTKYFKQNVKCGKKSQTHIVKDWIADLLKEEKVRLIWFDIMADWTILSKEVYEMEGDDSVKQQYYTILLHKLYLDYDTKKDIYEQMIERKKELDGLKEKIEKIIND